jgi:hypothetical protein
MAFLGTVIATGLPVDVFLLQACPPPFDLFVPVTPSPCTGIAPSKIVMVKTVIIINCHPIANIRALTDFFYQGQANIEEFQRPGDI